METTLIGRLVGNDGDPAANSEIAELLMPFLHRSSQDLLEIIHSTLGSPESAVSQGLAAAMVVKRSG